jgi:hypothetical protein
MKIKFSQVIIYDTQLYFINLLNKCNEKALILYLLESLEMIISNGYRNFKSTLTINIIILHVYVYVCVSIFTFLFI